MRLSDFKDEKAIEVVADLIDPISRMAQVVKAERDGSKNKNITQAQLVGIALKKCKKEAIEMFAILNDIPKDKYHCNGATILGDVMNMFSDPQLLQLFGLQSKIPTSSGSASESTEVAKK